MPKTKVKFKNLNGLGTDEFLNNFDKNNISLQQFFDLHEKFLNEKHIEGLAERTIYDHVHNMRYFKDYVLSVQRSELNHIQLDKSIFKNYIAYMLLDKKYAPCTINIRISTLKAYLNWLHKENYTSQNISLQIKKVKRPEDTILPLSKYEVKKMLNQPNMESYAGIRDFSIMILILDTGIRINELVNIKIDDVDIKNKLLYVKAENAKTRKHRELPLSKQSIYMLKQLIEIAVENKSCYVFMSSQTAYKVNKNVIIKNFENYGKKAGISHRCTPHIFRHTFAVNAVRKGIDIFTLQRIMGHANIATTRQYIQLDTRDLINAHDKMNVLNDFLRGGKR